MIDQNPIVLLGHPPVVRAEAGLDMEQRQFEGVRDNGARESAVRITLDDNRTAPRDRTLSPDDGLPDLLGTGRPADIQRLGNGGDFQVVEDQFREFAVKVLTRVD
jgi:hypothetical protein